MGARLTFTNLSALIVFIICSLGLHYVIGPANGSLSDVFDLKQYNKLNRAYAQLDDYLRSKANPDTAEPNFNEVRMYIKKLKKELAKLHETHKTDRKKTALLKACVQFVALDDKEASHDVCSKDAKKALVDNDEGTGRWLRNAQPVGPQLNRVRSIIFEVAKEQAKTCREHYFNVYQANVSKVEVQLKVTEVLVRDLLHSYLESKPQIVARYGIKDTRKVLKEYPYSVSRFASSIKFLKPTRAQLQILHNHLLKTKYAKSLRSTNSDLNQVQKLFYEELNRAKKKFDTLRYKIDALKNIAIPCEEITKHLGSAFEQTNFPPVSYEMRFDYEDPKKVIFYERMAIYQVCKNLENQRDIVFNAMVKYAKETVEMHSN